MSLRFTFSPQKILGQLVLIGSIACSIQPGLHAQTLEAQPTFEVGDKWTYRYHNTGDRKEPYLFTNQTYKSEGGSGWLYVEFQNNESPRKQAVHRYDYKRADVKERFDFNATKPTQLGKRYGNSQPADDWIQFPLTVGKKYEIKFDWDNGEGNNKYDVEVQSFEKVKTAAGEFDAYRIKASGWWTRTSNGSGSGRAEQVIHYAPSVKRVVKWDYFDRSGNGSTWNANNTELVKYEPKAALPAVLGMSVTVAAPVAPASAAQ